jgi:hypothetical protein
MALTKVNSILVDGAINTTAAGNVGIGTASPQKKLSVIGTDGASGQTEGNSRTSLFLDNNGANYLSIFTSTSGDGGIFFSDNGLNNGGMVYETSNDALYFRANNAERMRINSSGVGINTAPAGYIGNEQFMVAGTNTAGQYTTTITQAASSPSGGCNLFLAYSNAAPNNTSNSFLICNDNSGVQKLNIYSNGTVSNRTGTYNSLSDLKLKENVVDATPKLDKLMQVQVRNYNLIGDELKQIGFVAQELEQVFPSLVEDVPDYDKNQELTGEVTKMVKTSVLIPILVKAIQEQQTIITDLTTRLEALEAK